MFASEKRLRVLLLVSGLVVVVGIGVIQIVEGQMDDTARQTVLNAHNGYRSAFAKGGQVKNGNSGQYLGPASNMHQLIYDMTLEAFAQNWTNTCNGGHSNGNYGENYYGDSRQLNAAQAAQAAADSWWSEFQQGLPSNPTYIDAQDGPEGHATQMAWGLTTHVGCGCTWCPNLKYPLNFICDYTQAGNAENQNIYQPGNPCQQDSDCTAFAGSKCNATAGLCIPPN